MQSATPCDGWIHRRRIGSVLAAFGAFTVLAFAPSPVAAAGTLDQVRQSGKLTLGYRTDAAPFSYQDSAKKAVGYTVTLCQKIVDKMKAELGLASLNVDWVPVTLGDRFKDLQQGKVDMLCGADSATLSRMKDVAFSIPIFPGGIGAMLRADGDQQLRTILEDAPPLEHPVWRGAPARTFISKKTFSVVKGTTAESWLTGRLKEIEIEAEVVPVSSYEEGIQRVLNQSSDVLFGDRAVLMEAAKRSSSETVVDRLFTYEPIAIGIRRGDEDLRLLVDRSLSQLFRSAEMSKLYTTWFGKASVVTALFYQLTALPE